jgi:hypothetical protein
MYLNFLPNLNAHENLFTYYKFIFYIILSIHQRNKNE